MPSTSNTMPYPQVTLPILEALYRFGIQICDEIEEFKPDVVIGLAHSGWMPVVVAQTLWAETRKTPFPASLRTNIGLEKYDFYTERYGKKYPVFCCWTCCEGETDRIGHYLAWLAEQNQWQNSLRDQLETVFSSEPERIMVLDDIISGRCSGYAVLTWLEILYPNANTFFFAGRSDLTDNFVTGWLEQFVPELAKDLPGVNGNAPSRVRFVSNWQKLLKPLITGTEDISPDRLDWQFLNSGSEAVKALADHVPVDIILAAPNWAKELACSYALQRLKGEFKKDAVVEPEEDDSNLWPIRRLSIQPEESLAAKAWRDNGVTLEDIAKIYGDDPEKMKEGLKDVSMESKWQCQPQGADMIYYPGNAFEPWINDYPLPDAAESSRPDIPVHGFAEFLPCELWAGAYPLPVNLPDQIHADLFKDLLSNGITSIIDLTNPDDFHRRWSYRKILQQTSEQLGLKVKVKSFPLPFRSAPTRQEVDQIFGHISRSLKSGQRVFIHAGHNLEGRTPLILACLLIQRGYSPEQAIEKVTAFWMETLPFLICMPLSEPQREFISNWHR